MGYARTDGRTHGRTKTIFLVNGFENTALRAGQKQQLGLGKSPVQIPGPPPADPGLPLLRTTENHGKLYMRYWQLTAYE